MAFARFGDRIAIGSRPRRTRIKRPPTSTRRLRHESIRRLHENSRKFIDRYRPVAGAPLKRLNQARTRTCTAEVAGRPSSRGCTRTRTGIGWLRSLPFPPVGGGTYTRLPNVGAGLTVTRERSQSSVVFDLVIPPAFVHNSLVQVYAKAWTLKLT